MSYRICPECAYSTADGNRKYCEYCCTELLDRCLICGDPIEEERAMFCRACGVKLRQSICLIQ